MYWTGELEKARLELKKWYAERKAAIIEIACLTLQLEALHNRLAFCCTGPWGWWKAAIVLGMILATAFRRILAVARLVRVETLVQKACGRVSTAAHRYRGNEGRGAGRGG